MRINPDRRYSKQGLFLCAVTKIRGMDIGLVPLPHVNEIATNKGIVPRTPSVALIKEFNKACIKLDDVLNGRKVAMHDLNKRMHWDETASTKLNSEQGKSFSAEARIGTDSGELCIGRRHTGYQRRKHSSSASRRHNDQYIPV